LLHVSKSEKTEREEMNRTKEKIRARDWEKKVSER